jgi:superfamily II DNA or RNA helicase
MTSHFNTLRPYQQQLLKECSQHYANGVRSVLLCAPTGSGKTKMFTYVAAAHKGSVLTITHRLELYNQVEVGEAIMVETLNNILKTNPHYLHQYSFVIVDECHLNSFNKIFEHIHFESKVLGVTATPLRKTKDKPLKDFYNVIVQGIDTPQLIQDGYLCEAKSYGVDIDLKGLKKSGDDYDTATYYETNKTFEGVVSNWKRLCENTKTIVFSSNIKSSQQVCEEFLRNGYNAKHIDGTTPLKEREDILHWFDKTPNAIVCNCGILTTGFNQPDIKTIVLYRATTSLPLFLQMCGRGSRKAEGKNHFNILDFGNNIQRLGFWEQDRVWHLAPPKKNSNKKNEAPAKTCKKCGAINYASARVCCVCGAEFEKTKKEKEEARLVLLENRILGKKLSELSIDELIIAAETKKVKHAMVWRVLRSRGKAALVEFQEKKGYNRFWVNGQLENIKDNSYYDARIS